MEVTELKNYGNSYVDLTMSLSKKEKKEIDNISFKVMRDSLGLLKTFRLLISGFFQSQKMKRVNLDPVREKGFSNDVLIKEAVRNAAMFSVLSKMVGKDRALEVFNRVIDATIPIYYQSFSPDPEDILKFDNPWETWKQYINTTL